MSETTKSRVGHTQSAAYTALVTGAARRIGACIAESLHRRGCDVFVHYHQSSDAVEQLADKLNTLRPASAIIVQADLGETDDINHLAGQVRAHTGQLDLLVNNASRLFARRI